MTATAVLIASIALQVVAALLALRLMRTTASRRAWGLIAGAIGLMAVRRMVTLAEIVVGDERALSLPAELVALAISISMVLGLAAIRPLFERLGEAAELEAGFGRVLDNSLSEFYLFAADDLRFLRVNLGAQENLGYSADELAEMTPIDLKHEFTEESFRELLAPLLSGEEPRVRFKTDHTRKDGSTYPVEVDLQATRYRGRRALVATILDTSERDEAERALRESEANYRSLIEHSQDLVAVLDTDGSIAYMSPSISWVLGHPAEERLGRSGFELIHPDDVGKVQATLAAALADPSSPRTETYRLRHADGSWRTMEGVGSVRELPDGRRQFVINQRDISQRALAQEEKAKVEAQLQQVQRMETLWTLAGGVAHDFNNLLTPIIGYANLLKDELAGQPAAREEVGEILRAAARAQKLVRHLLAFSRQAEQELVAVELESIVGEALQLVRSILPTNIDLEVRLDTAGEVVLADATQIHQVIMNLCANAEQVMRGGGGTLSVSLEKVDELPPAVGEAVGSKGPHLQLAVRDTGPGIDEETKQRIFDPFFTTKGVGEGTGLGLSIVEGIVLNHGGAIHVDTAPGEGATFHVFFPSVGMEAVEQEAGVAADVGGREHILVVDDEIQVGTVMQRLLESRGYRTTLAGGPKEALKILGSTSVDLVVTDQTMPSMTGLELAERIGRAHPGLPVVLVTGFSYAATPERRAQAGIAAALNKPFAGPELAACVRNVLDEASGVAADAAGEPPSTGA